MARAQPTATKNRQQQAARAWLLLAFGNERSYAGNSGYDDDLANVYRYDSFVPNHRQIAEGDFALLRDKEALTGLARIERIAVKLGTKERLRCPVCGQNNFTNRKRGTPAHRCVEGHEFDAPARDMAECSRYEAFFGTSFVPAPSRVELSALRAACPRYNRQLAMQEIDLSHLQSNFAELAPLLARITASHIEPQYLDAEAAAGVNSHDEDVGYLLRDDDKRQIVHRQLRERRGQATFRQALRTRYGDQCLVSGCHLLDIVEAAHISPHRGESDNHPENGLLLRSDLHTLFDLDLLGVDPKTLEVRFHSAALEAGYSVFQDRRLQCGADRPSEAALEIRWQTFQDRLRRS